jgi:hypothetical protein
MCKPQQEKFRPDLGCDAFENKPDYVSISNTEARSLIIVDVEKQ